MALIPNYKKGSDLTLINIMYKKLQKNEETGKWEKDYADIIFKDNVTQKKHHYLMHEPTYRYYLLNDDVMVPSHNLFFAKLEDTHPVECKYTDLEKSIAENTDNTEFYYNTLRQYGKSATSILHTLPSVLSSDVDIEDHLRARFAQDYVNDVHNISKAYFDIETDIHYCNNDFPYPGQVPVNAISYINEETKKLTVFILRDKNNPNVEVFEKSITPSLFSELKEFIKFNVGGEDGLDKFNLRDIEYNFLFFDEEIQLIQTFFMMVNRDEPDFLLAWNMAFDIPYLIERIKILGYDPAIIMSHPDFEVKYAKYYIDEKHKNEYEARGDRYDIAGYTVYIDQLIQFASIRKGQAAFENFKLDTAGSVITGVRKLDYSHITTQLGDLPYLDFKTFIFYNIMDTVVQKCIESKVGDIDYVYGAAIINDTRYAKVHRQTIYLTNLTRKEFLKAGYVLGNNVNSGGSIPFAGALVGDPLHNSDYAKMTLDIGTKLWLYNNLDDFDFKALYPSITSENNMAPHTQIGKIIIDEFIHNLENPYNYNMYDRGGQFTEDLASENTLEFCARWLGLARFKDLLSDIQEYFTTVKRPLIPMNLNVPFEILNHDVKIQPFMFLDDDGRIVPFVISPDNEHKQQMINMVLLNRR